MGRITFILLCLLSTKAFGFEEILGVQYDAKGVTFQVTSSGCTTKDNFSFVVLDSYPMGLLLTRERIDPCEAHVPFGVKINYSYAELGFNQGAEFKILNPLHTFKVPVEEKAKK